MSSAPGAEAFANPREIERVLRETRTWAVVGCSSNPGRPSHGVSRTLMRFRYEVIPVNPRETAVHGLTAYPDLRSAALAAAERGGRIDVVDIFRRASLAGAHVDEAIEIGARAVWMQLGVVDDDAASRARRAGLLVVMDRCPAIELPLLSPPLEHDQA